MFAGREISPGDGWDLLGQRAYRLGLPDITRGSLAAAALGLGVFAVWLLGFLSPKQEHQAHITLSGVHLYPQEVSGQIGYSTRPDPALTQDTAHRLEQQPE